MTTTTGEPLDDPETFIEVCDECGAVYPMYMSPNWDETIGQWCGHLCKPCFEKRCPRAEYDSLETYIAKCAKSFGCDLEEAMMVRDDMWRSALPMVWDGSVGESILSQYAEQMEADYV